MIPSLIKLFLVFLYLLVSGHLVSLLLWGAPTLAQMPSPPHTNSSWATAVSLMPAPSAVVPGLPFSVCTPELTRASKSLHREPSQSFKYQKITPFTTCSAIISVKNYPGVFICDNYPLPPTTPSFLTRERLCAAVSFRSARNPSLIFMACFAKKQW